MSVKILVGWRPARSFIDPRVVGCHMEFGVHLPQIALEEPSWSLEALIEYAESADVPMPELAAPFASGMMLLGGVGIALWRFPRIATGAAAAFLAVVTTTMHDFWNAEEGSKSGERLAFFGNMAMLGGVLVFLREAYK